MSVTLRLCVMMFLQFFVWGAWYVSVGTFLGSKAWDLGGIESDGRAAYISGVVADAYTVGPLAAIVAPLFCGLIADRHFATQRVLAAMHLVGGGLMALAAWYGGGDGGSPSFLVWSILLPYMLCYMPTLGLTNTLAFHNISDPERQFPLIRVFGTLGWIAANNVTSAVFQADASELQFTITAASSVALAAFSLALPHTPPPAADKTVTAAETLGLGALELLRQRPFVVFIVCSFLICIPLAAYYSFAPVFVDQSGLFAKSDGTTEVAFYMSFGQWAEVLFMLVMPLFFARLGVKWMLAVGMLAWVVRYGLFAAAGTSGAWMVMAGILLHGICYDFFFVTGQIYVDQMARKEIRAQAQSFLVVMTLGFGLLIGAQVSGQVVAAHSGPDGRDWSAIWTWPCWGALAILVLFVLLFRAPRARGDDSAAQPA